MNMPDLRTLLARLEDTGDLVAIDGEVKSELEMAGIIKALDDGPIVLFNNITGFPTRSTVANIFSRRDRIARLMGTTADGIPRAYLEAIQAPIAPRAVRSAASQEVVFRGGDVDLTRQLPVPIQTERDAGRIITGGVAMVRLPDRDGFNLSYHRMRVLDRNSTTLAIQGGRHLLQAASRLRKTSPRIPLTVIVGCAPATLLAAAGPTQSTSIPYGYDELGLAGALMGRAQEVIPAVAVPGAWSLADAEYVLEGYLDTDTYVYEHEAKTVAREFFMPEAAGYMGRAWKTFRFEVTAVTHRAKPIYYFPIATTYECINMMAIPAEASVYHTCKQIDPDMFETCTVLPGMRGVLGMVLRLRKERPRDEGLQTNMLFGALASHSDMGWAIAVDHDVDIYDANDVWWAVVTRARPEHIFTTPKARVSGMLGESATAGVAGKIVIDATYPLAERDRYVRPDFPEVQLERWLSKQQIEQIRAMQSDYAKSLARMRS